MNGFSILMFIFSICILLVGIYTFTGHKLELIAWKAQYKGLTIKGWKNIGKWLMIVSIIPFIVALIGLLFID